MKSIRIFLLLIVAAWNTPAWARYTVVGVAGGGMTAAQNRTAFVALLNAFSVGGQWGLNVADQLVFTPNGNPVNLFVSRINFFNNNANRTVRVGRNQPGVVAGAFLGGGVQELDLNDILAFPANIAADPVADLQSAVTMHELAELFQDGGVNNFPAAHGGAIIEENSELTARGSRGMRQPPPDRFIPANPPVRPRPLIRIPWREVGVGLGGLFIEIPNNNVTGARFIRGGLVDLNVSFDTSTSEDIPVGNIAFRLSPECRFDTNGDGTPELTITDDDGDGFCDWPPGTTVLPGTLTFTSATPVAFSGVTAVTAERIIVEEGGVLLGEPGVLSKLTLTARIKSFSDIISRGTLDLAPSDDLILQATGSVSLTGTTNLEAGDRVVLKASQGNVTVAPAAFDSVGPFTLFGRNRIEISARGANGSIDIARARVASYRILVRTRATVSVVGPKQLRLSDRTLLTTDRAQTGLPNASNIQLDATGTVVVTGDTALDSGTGISVVSRREQDNVCLSQNARLEASNGLGPIYLTNVRGLVFDDGTTSFVGRVFGADRIVAGTCP